MKTTSTCEPGRSRRDVMLVAREARRLVGLERSYECSRCGAAHSTWDPLRSCPGCGEPLGVAVIRRAAFA